jgi:hypothetical protein
VARRGADAMALAEQTEPDVFLIDYHLVDWFLLPTEGFF